MRFRNGEGGAWSRDENRPFLDDVQAYVPQGEGLWLDQQGGANRRPIRRYASDAGYFGVLGDTLFIGGRLDENQ